MTLLHPDKPAPTEHGETSRQANADGACSTCVNVGATERWVSTAGGAAMVVAGLKRGGLGGLALAALGGGLVYRGATGHCSAYSALGIDTARQQPAEPGEYFERGIHVEQSVTVEKPAAELYAYWRKFENLPAFMNYLESVTVIDDKRSHWVAKAPAGQSVSWDAEIINDNPGELIAWRSLAGAAVDNAGSVRFVAGPEQRGTEVRVVLDYIPPGGRLGALVAKLLGHSPDATVREDLRRFKQRMETGETPTTEGQPHGRR